MNIEYELSCANMRQMRSLGDIRVFYVFYIVKTFVYGLAILQVFDRPLFIIQNDPFIVYVCKQLVWRMYYMITICRAFMTVSIYLYALAHYIIIEQLYMLIMTIYSGKHLLTKNEYIIAMIAAGFTGLEALCLFFNSINKRDEIQLIRFKKIGTSPEINEAYKLRQRLNLMCNYYVYKALGALAQFCIFYQSSNKNQIFCITQFITDIFLIGLIYFLRDEECKPIRKFTIIFAAIKTVYMFYVAVVLINTEPVYKSLKL